MLALNTQASARHPSIVSTKHFLRSWPHLRTALSPPHMKSMSVSNASTLIYGQPRCFVAVQASALSNTAAVDELAPARQLLDCYWQAQGVFDASVRSQMVDFAVGEPAGHDSDLDASKGVSSTSQQAGASSSSGADESALLLFGPGPIALSRDAPMPGIPASWTLQQSAPEVLEVSRRLLALQQLLGGWRTSTIPRTGSSSQSSSSAIAAAAAASAGMAGFSPPPAVSAASGMSAGSYVAGSAPGGVGVVDVVWMVQRAPRLLSADMATLMQRLVEMKLAVHGWGVDVLRVVEAQPALLVSDTWQVDLQSLTALREASDSQAAHARAGISPASVLAGSQDQQQTTTAAAACTSANLQGEEALATAAVAEVTSAPTAVSSAQADEADAINDLLAAWQHGISSDTSPEWRVRYSQLVQYKSVQGDAYVGFGREGDDPELGRWANKQRSQYKAGELAPERYAALCALSFEWDADEAEWSRWYAALRMNNGLPPSALVTSQDIYLSNWCAIQRIARRSRVLHADRIQRLDELGFDWTGADPLS